MQPASMFVRYARHRTALQLSASLVAALALGACGQELSIGSEQGSIVGGTTTNDYPAVANISARVNR